MSKFDEVLKKMLGTAPAPRKKKAASKKKRPQSKRRKAT